MPSAGNHPRKFALTKLVPIFHPMLITDFMDPEAAQDRRLTPPLALPGQTVGLLGGSFNPPHQGHALITEIAFRRLGLDRIWWLVTPGNPLKDKHELAPLSDRLDAAEAVAPPAIVSVTGLEAGLPTTFTAATLTHLLSTHPGVRFVWLMGADNLAQVHRWQRWQSIFERVPIAVVNRPGWHLKALSSPAARRYDAVRVPEARCREILTRPAPTWTFLTGPLSDLSSSAIRRSRRQGG